MENIVHANVEPVRRWSQGLDGQLQPVESMGVIDNLCHALS